MSLVADYGSDSNESVISDDEIASQIVPKTEPPPSSSSSSSEEEETIKDVKPPQTSKLPTPKFTTTNSNSSVFVNPFLEAENAEEAMLQRHVKMVNAQDPILINGKKICWNHRKGRCRYGHTCKYAHDSDLRKSDEQLTDEIDRKRAESVVCKFGGTNHGVPIENKVESNHKRKRPGLSLGLVPGKKVMKQYLINKS